MLFKFFIINERLDAFSKACILQRLFRLLVYIRKNLLKFFHMNLNFNSIFLFFELITKHGAKFQVMFQLKITNILSINY